MAPRSIWKGSLGFGMVAVPVKLYSSTEEKTTRFNQLHAVCGSRIQMPKWCPQCDRKVEGAELVKGFPLEEGNFVQLTESDLATLPLASVKSVTIDGFIGADSEEVRDPRWVTDNYFVVPDEEKSGRGQATRAFCLLMKAMEAASVVGVSKVAMRDREHLCLVRPYGGMLFLQVLHWGDELRDYEALLVSANLSEKEMLMGIQLVTAMKRDDLELGSYEDDYRKALQALLDAKLSGTVLPTPAAPAPPSAVDLADMLLASLNAAKVGKA